jgi:hypothetical protein
MARGCRRNASLQNEAHFGIHLTSLKTGPEEVAGKVVFELKN